MTEKFVEVEPGYFIQVSQYNNLIFLGVLPWEMRSYLRKKVRHMNMWSSQRGKPLKNQDILPETGV